ncbi:MAG: V-type ATPase subunit, partial [Candidatus Firestonebacteria bacterium]|nr:V-type ATPase subunit [Candidatus Firestonebacteria bacterium]
LNKEIELLRELIYEGGHFLPLEFEKFYNDKTLNKFVKFFSNTPYKILIQESIKYLRENNLVSAEQKLDNFLLKWMEDSKFVVFGVEPLIYYILRKEYEIRVLRIILISKIYNIKPELIHKNIDLHFKE